MPPNPNELDMAISTRLSCALKGTKLKSVPTLGLWRFSVGGTAFCEVVRARMVAGVGSGSILTSEIASTENMASTAPAAPSRWPIAPFVLLTVTWLSFSTPSSASIRVLIALASAASPIGVLVA